MMRKEWDKESEGARGKDSMRQIWSWNIKRLYELMKLTRSKVQGWQRVQGQKMWRYSISSRIMKHQGQDELSKVETWIMKDMTWRNSRGRDKQGARFRGRR